MWANDDIPRVWVTVNPSPLEDLCAEELDHRLHDSPDTTLQRFLLCEPGSTLVFAHQTFDASPIGQPDTVNPFHNKDLLCGHIVIDLRNVNPVGKPRFCGNQTCRSDSILCFQLEIELSPKMVCDEI